MNTNDSWSWDWEKEKTLYDEQFSPLQAAFDKAIESVPEEHRLALGGRMLDSCWDIVYRKNFGTSSPITKNGLPPEINRSLLRHKRVSSRTPVRPAEPQKPTAQMERLAMLVHHNCVLTPRDNQGAFQQALSSILMSGSLIGGVVGDSDKWGYLADKSVESVDYTGRKISVWTKEFWKLAAQDVKTFTKAKKNRFRARHAARKTTIKCFLKAPAKAKLVVIKKSLKALFKNPFKKPVQITPGCEKSAVYGYGGVNEISHVRASWMTDSLRDILLGKEPQRYIKQPEIRVLKFKKPKYLDPKHEMREKLAIEFLKNAKGQV